MLGIFLRSFGSAYLLGDCRIITRDPNFAHGTYYCSVTVITGLSRKSAWSCSQPNMYYGQESLGLSIFTLLPVSSWAQMCNNLTA